MGKIVVAGATGNIGSKIAATLLDQKQQVVVIARTADKLKSLGEKGAEVKAGNLTDSNFLTGVLKGADSAFLLVPPDYSAPDARKHQNEVADSLLAAVQGSGIKHVVLLSSVGAHLKEGAGIVQGIYDMEQKFAKANTNVLFLRPGYFMENLFWQIPTMKGNGITGSAIKADVKFSLVATADIAAVAAKLLVDKNFQGISHRYVLGAEDLNYNEITEKISAAVGVKLNYVTFPYEDAEKAMIGGGLSPSSAKAMADLARAMNDGTFQSDVKRNSESTTPTKLEQFLPALVGAYKS